MVFCVCPNACWDTQGVSTQGEGSVCPGVCLPQCMLGYTGGCLPRGRGCLPGGGRCLPQCMLGYTPPPWTEWLTDRCKNIAFQLLYDSTANYCLKVGEIYAHQRDIINVASELHKDRGLQKSDKNDSKKTAEAIYRPQRSSYHAVFWGSYRIQLLDPRCRIMYKILVTRPQLRHMTCKFTVDFFN